MRKAETERIYLVNKFAKLAGRVKNDIAYSIPYSGKTDAVAPHDNNQPVLLDTAIGSQNTGDQIIMGFVNEHLSKFMDTENAIRIPTHVMDPDVYTPDVLNRAKILCGTNALFSDFDLHPSISLPASPRWYSHQVVLMAVGMRSTKRAPHFDFLTAKILQNLLSPDYLHSVRDEHTRTELARIGIDNVINTACVTMWNLTEKFCEDIPVSKAENVLTTITDYDFDPVNDEYMLQTLGHNYRHVYLWLQGSGDKEKLQEINLPSNIQFIENGLDGLRTVIAEEPDLEYFGTRLHCGIYCLNHHLRSMIVSIDNRADDIASDTNLPIVKRTEIRDAMGTLINRDRRTQIRIPEENIHTWINQFK